MDIAPARPEHGGVLATAKVWPIDVGVHGKGGATANLDGVFARRQRAAEPEGLSALCRGIAILDKGRTSPGGPQPLSTAREQIQIRQYDLSP